jgi:signal transduction histidine kinase
MDIRLVSEDRELLDLCREILAENPEQSCNLSTVQFDPGSAAADLYIWDFDPKFPVPDLGRLPEASHLFLIDRKDLAAFSANSGPAGPMILLKPVTRPTLAAFLGLAVSFQARHSLRADRDEIFQCLIQTNLKLQEYEQERTNFLARATHDFRAPLTALGGYCGLLLSGALDPVGGRQKEVLQRMQQSVRRLSRLAESMFQLSVGRNVKSRPNLEAGDLRDCVEQALHEIGPLSEERQIAVSLSLAPSEHESYFEAGQIEQVLVNILDNACRFTPRFGRIEIRGYPYFWERRSGSPKVPREVERRCRTSQEFNSYRIDILDSGPLIPEDRLERIFEEHTSYSGGADRSGSGLGLAICRFILHQHDGTIWAENTDSGPMFSFALPAHRLEPEPAGPTELEAMERVSL